MAVAAWGMAPPLTGGRQPTAGEAGLFAVFAVRRTWPSPAERSRALPNCAPGPSPLPPERRLASERAAAAAEEAPPQGEEVPARRRPPAAEAAPVAPRRERPAEAARQRGRAGGGDVAPARLPRPPPAGFRASVGAQHLAALDPLAGVHRAQLR